MTDCIEQVREALAAVQYAMATRGAAYVEAVLRELERDIPPDVIVKALLRADQPMAQDCPNCKTGVLDAGGVCLHCGWSEEG